MSKKPPSEEAISELIQRSQHGDTEAFGKLYDLYFEKVYRFAAVRVPEEIAEDLVADIFVKAWQKLGLYKPQKNVPFGAWLFKIARNEVIDTYRTSRTFEEVPEEMVDTDDLNLADTKVKRSYVLKTVRTALKTLPKRYQEVLSLSFMADLPNAEIARVLRISEGSVRILKFRALKKLEDNLPKDLYENL